MAPALQLGRMDVPAEVDREWNEWYSTIYVPNYEKVPGVIRGRRLSRRRRHADLSDVLRVRTSQGVRDSGVEQAA